jgi:hypothetical protein
MQRWEYMYLDFAEMKARSVNGQELRDWKKHSLIEYLASLGDQGWEMVGTLTSNNYDYGRLFFKRAKA